MSSWGCGGRSDSPSPLSSNDGHGTASVDGSPLAAKLTLARTLLEQETLDEDDAYAAADITRARGTPAGALAVAARAGT